MMQHKIQEHNDRIDAPCVYISFNASLESYKKCRYNPYRCRLSLLLH
jgi:hypothetical protein